MNTLTLLLGLLVGLALGALVGGLWTRGRPGAVALESAEVMQGLDRLSDQVHHLDQERVRWEGRLDQQVLDMRQTADGLGRETRSLSTALRRPEVRGRWGEMHLRRAVELAGMVDRCDFTEQHRLDGGAQRPDLVVRLVGDRCVVVDAKVPLDAYLDVTGCDDPAEQAAHLARHARQVRTHVDQLGAKAYWRSLSRTPEFVVLFVPAESFLSAALEADPTLIEHAATRQVVLATPTTLIALLRTVAHGWSHEVLADQAAEIHRLGRELHVRLSTLSGHLDQVGQALNRAVGHYNSAMGSLESRVLVSARRFSELGVTEDGLDPPRPVVLRAVDRRAAPQESEGGPSLAL